MQNSTEEIQMRIVRKLCPYVALIPLLAAHAHAEPYAIVSKIEAVTVFPDGALVTRGATIDVAAGASVLAFKNLPNDLDPTSLRVTGLANSDMTIDSVATHLVPAESKPSGEVETQLRELRAQREQVRVTLDALDAKKTMVLHFASTNPKDLLNGTKSLAISEWPDAFDTIAAALLKIGDDIRVASAKERDLDSAIIALSQTQTDTQGELAPRREVDVEIHAGAALKGHVALSYRVAHAGWRPVYDARLETGNASSKPSLELVRRAAVSQLTGEDWTDVALAVSTTRTSRTTAAPDMETLRLIFAETYVGRAAPTAGLRMLEKAAPRAEADALPAPAPPLAALEKPDVKATEKETTLDAGAFQATFNIPGSVSLAADGTTKIFSINSRRIAPELAVKSVPAIDLTAYLESHFVNEDEAPLLAGTVALYRGGNFIGRGEIDFVAPGDALDLGFGADDRVKVTRLPIKRKENEPNWFGQTKSEAREYKTIVKNLHDFPIKIVLIDQIPVSENTSITVEQLPATTPPTEKTVADKRGVMSWTYDYTPGQTHEVHLAYRMKWPGDREVLSEHLPPAAK
jgi:uncharacterized protein (TIGR02231 family)